MSNQKKKTGGNVTTNKSVQIFDFQNFESFFLSKLFTMLPKEINEFPSEVIEGIFKLLNVDQGEFMYRLFNDEPKEVMIYAKIFSLYKIVNDYKTCEG